uniref:MyTH4 domain-containing protein n=3 Tax=Canis lupus TaxID=9612 RepID=A0A8C0PV37_CANLF
MSSPYAATSPTTTDSIAYASLSTDSHSYTMQEFALCHFRKPQPALWGSMGAPGPTIQSLWPQAPIKESLISLSDEDTNKQAVESFRVLMQFMGDQPKPRGKNDLELLYELLKLCREENLRDEIYCQVIKQVTCHPQPEHCTRGWNLLSLLTGCFSPSATLMPYVIKFLQNSGSSQELARNSQEHLQRTVKYGGRQRLPSLGEIQAFLKGQGMRSLLIHLPGGVDYRTTIQTFTVAAEVVEELCRQMGITDPQEMQEFALFLIKKEGELVRPLLPHEYLNSVVEQDTSLHSRRLIWETPLHFDNPTYITTHYKQVSCHPHPGLHAAYRSLDPGLQLANEPLPGWGTSKPPPSQDMLNYLPKPLRGHVNIPIIKKLIDQELRQLQVYNSQEAQISFIEAVSQLPLFGYTVYVVLRVSQMALPGPSLLGLNHQHLIVMDPCSQKQCCSITLKDLHRLHLLSPLESEGPPGLELNYGSADNPQTIWFELLKAQELMHTIVFLTDRGLPSK